MIEAPGLVYYLHHIAQSAGELRRGTSKNINYPNFPKKVRKQIYFRELWRRIKFLSTTFAFSASNCGALGAAAENKKALDFSANWLRFCRSPILTQIMLFSSDDAFFVASWIISWLAIGKRPPSNILNVFPQSYWCQTKIKLFCPQSYWCQTKDLRYEWY